MFFPKRLLLASVSLSLFLFTTTFASPVKLDSSKRFDFAPGKPGAALDRVDDVSPGVHNLDPSVVKPSQLTRRQDVYDEVRGHRSAGSSPQDRKRGQPHFNDQGDNPPGGDGPPQGHGPPVGDNPPQGHGPPGPWMKRNLVEREQSVAAASNPHQLSHPVPLADLQERGSKSDQDVFFDDDDDDGDGDFGPEKRDVEDNDVNMPTFWEPAPDPKVPIRPHRPPSSVELQEKRDVKDDSSDAPGPGGAPGFAGNPAPNPVIPKHPHRPPRELHEKRYFEDVDPIPGSGDAPWYNGDPAPNPVFPKPPKHPHRPPGPIVLYERDEVFDPPYARYTPQERAAQPASHLGRRDSEQKRNIESEAFHWSWAPRIDKDTPLNHGPETRPHIGHHESGLERRDSEPILSGVDVNKESGWVANAPSHKAREGLRDGPALARRYRPSGGYKPPEGGPDEQQPNYGTQESGHSDGPTLTRRPYFPGPGNEPWASTVQPGSSGSSESGSGGPSRRSLVNDNGVRFVGAKRSEQESVNDIHLDSGPTDHHVPALSRRYHPSGGFNPPSGGSGDQSGSSRSDGNGRGGPPHLGKINESGDRFVGAERSEHGSVSDVHLNSVPTYHDAPTLASRGHAHGPPSNGPNDQPPNPGSHGRGGPPHPGSISDNGIHLVGAKRSEHDSISRNHLLYPPLPHPPPGDDSSGWESFRHGVDNEHGARYVGDKRSVQESIDDIHLDSAPHSPYIPRPPPDDDGSGWDDGGPQPWWHSYGHGGNPPPAGQVNEHGVRYVGAKRSEANAISDIDLDSVSTAKYSHIPDPDPISGGNEWNGGPMPWGIDDRRPATGEVNENVVRFAGSKRSVEAGESVGERHLGKRSSLLGDDGGVLEGVHDQSQESGAWEVSDPYNRGCTKDDHCKGRPGQVKFAKRDGVDHEGDQTPPALHYPIQRVTDLTSETRDLNANIKQNPQLSQSAVVDPSNPLYTSLISPSIYITSSLEHQPASALGFYGICRCDRFPDDGKLDGQSSSAIGSCVSKFVEIASKTAKCRFSTIGEVDCVEVGGKEQMTDGDNVWWQQAFCKRCVDAGGVSDASFKCPAGYSSDGKVDASSGNGSAGMGQRDTGGVESEKRSGLVPGSDHVAGQSRTDPGQEPGDQE